MIDVRKFQLLLGLALIVTLFPWEIQAAESCQSVFSTSTADSSYISFDKFKEVQTFPVSSGTATMLRAKVADARVVIKFRSFEGYTKDMESLKTEQVRIARNSLVKEANWLRWLNARQIGVPFVGFTSVRNNLALVIKEVAEPNILIKAPNAVSEIKSIVSEIRSQGFYTTSETIAEFKRVAKILEEAVIMPVDIQFLLTSSGKLILIDPEHFVQLPSSAKKQVQSYDEIHSFLQLLRALQTDVK